jgi:5-formyltetrahydrofolate cyclo-ligase
MNAAPALFRADPATLAQLPLLAVSSPALPPPETKAGWRAVADARLRARPQNIRLQHARLLRDLVLALLADAPPQIVGLYAPLGSEPDTRELANALLAAGHQLAYPRLRGDGEHMDLCHCTGPTALVPRPRSRLFEPVGAPVDPAQLGLLVVPCLALHPQGFRLGRGGGYYDRWLPQLPPTTLRIAAVAAEAILPFGPLEAHDARLDLALTEFGLCRPLPLN